MSTTTFGAVLGLSSQALFFEVTAEKADQRCSTLWLPQCGQAIFTLPCSTMVKVLEKVFLQALQKNSYWGIRTSTVLMGDGRILDPLVGRFNMGSGHGFCVAVRRVNGFEFKRIAYFFILFGGEGIWVTENLGWMYWCRGLTLRRWRQECRLVKERFSLFSVFCRASLFGISRCGGQIWM